MERTRFLKKFIPLFALAIFLPMVVIAATAPGKNLIESQAGNERELRVWIEPSTLIIAKDKSVKVKVVAQYDTETKVIPFLGGKLVASDASIVEVVNSFEYSKPFSGTISVGEVEVKALKAGSATLAIDQATLDMRLPTKLETITSNSTIIVR